MDISTPLLFPLSSFSDTLGHFSFPYSNSVPSSMISPRHFFAGYPLWKRAVSCFFFLPPDLFPFFLHSLPYKAPRYGFPPFARNRVNVVSGSPALKRNPRLRLFFLLRFPFLSSSCGSLLAYTSFFGLRVLDWRFAL